MASSHSSVKTFELYFIFSALRNHLEEFETTEGCDLVFILRTSWVDENEGSKLFSENTKTRLTISIVLLFALMVQKQ